MRNLSLFIVFAVVITFAAVAGCGDSAREDTAPAVARSSRLAEVLGAGDIRGYALALRPRAFVFPEDHGKHPEYRNEWWYVTGNLDGAGDERFGFELTIFRFSLAPQRHAEKNEASSAWATNQIYIGHFAVTDVASRKFHVAQRYARGALGLAGAKADSLHVWLENWHLRESSASADNGMWQLHAQHDGVDLSLSLTPVKAPVLNGVDGLSRKSAAAGNASYYYSIPRLQASGTLTVDKKTHTVSGLAWLDREWGSGALSPEQQGWDWFALQLSDGSDLMFYQLRKTDGTTDSHSAGTWISASGDSVRLAHDDVTIQVRDYWDSPHGGRYPMAWTIGVPQLGLDLRVDPVLQAQELATDVRYWEGAVDVGGEREGMPVGGRGYVELTGYARE